MKDNSYLIVFPLMAIIVYIAIEFTPFALVGIFIVVAIFTDIISNDTTSSPSNPDKTDFISVFPTQNKLHPMWMSTEAKQEYMKTIQWKTLKQQRLSLANNKCECCGIEIEMYSSNCHHIGYERLGNELLSDLVILCPDCHENQHFHYGMDRQTTYIPLVNIRGEYTDHLRLINNTRIPSEDKTDSVKANIVSNKKIASRYSYRALRKQKENK